MTKNEFLNELQECGEFYSFHGKIRQKGTDYCPILALAHKRGITKDKSGPTIQNSWAQQYAMLLGIDRPLVFEIIGAADNDGDYKTLRPDLLNLCK